VSASVTLMAVTPTGDVYDVPATAEAIHEAIGGYLEAATIGAGFLVYCNEDGQRLNLPMNLPLLVLTNRRILGTVVVMGDPVNGVEQPADSLVVNLMREAAGIVRDGLASA
jgi:hypothetical protein